MDEVAVATYHDNAHQEELEYEEEDVELEAGYGVQ